MAGNKNIFLIVCGITVASLLLCSELALRMKAFPPNYDINDTVWFQKLHAAKQASEKDKTVIFYGSSRTQLGVSPDDFCGEMKRLGNKATCWNLAMSNSNDAGILAHVGEKLYGDVIVIEQIGLNLSNPIRTDDAERYRRVKTQSWGQDVDDLAGFKLARSVFFLRNNITRSFLNKRYEKMEYHDNGWLEVRYNKDPVEIERQKRHWEAYSVREQIPVERARTAQRAYKEIFDRLIREGSRVVILRMPVGGVGRKMEDMFMSCGYHTDFIRNDPRILYIDANIHPVLSQYHAVEDSHLDAGDAVGFSRDLAGIIDAWLGHAGKN